MMKAVAVIEKGRVEVVESPVPEYGEYECLVRIRAGGICNSTDVKIMNDQISNMKVKYPILLGHENAGEIIETGAKVRHLKIGDKVAGAGGKLGKGSRFNSMWAFLAEYAVMADMQAMIEDGAARPGALLEDYGAKLIPADMSYEDANILLTMKENYSALKNFGVTAGTDVLIYGDGPVGFGLTSTLRLFDAGYVACVGHHADRLDRIKKIIANGQVVNSNDASADEALAGRKFDLVIDAVGKTEIIKEGAQRLKPGGAVGMYGVLHTGADSFNLLDMPTHSRLHMLNFPYKEHRTHDEILALVAEGKLNPKDYYSHVVPIEDAKRAFELVMSREAYKVILSM